MINFKKPDIGTICHGRSLDLDCGIKPIPTLLYIYTECEVCKTPRWARYINGSQKTNLCNSCSKKNLNPINYFWEHVNKNGPVIREELGQCWVWTMSSRNQDGYGLYMLNKKSTLTHRYSYEITYGKFDLNLCILHKCDNPPCVRPDHLFIGTRQDNKIDAVTKGKEVGELNGTHILKEYQVIEIIKRYKSKENPHSIYKDYKELIAYRTLTDICFNITWKYIKRENI